MAQPQRIPARTLHRIWAPFFKAVQERHDAFLNDLDDRLMEASERAIDSQRAAQNFALSRQVRMGSSTIRQHFRERLHAALISVDETEGAGDLTGDGLELSLMDDADTEREVALRKLVTSARSSLSEEIDALETVTRDYDLATPPEAAPWHPHALGEAFLEAMEAVPLSADECLLLLHWFDRDMLREMQPEMQALLQDFREAGFTVPQVRQTTRRPAGRSDPNAGQTAPTGAPPGTDLCGTGTASGHWGQFGYQVPLAGQVMTATGQVPAGSPVEAITTVLNTSPASTLEPFIMDLLQGLFDLILKRDDLNPALREPLADLQLPLVRIAMRETHFFRDRTHPARQITGLLLNIALRIDPDLPLDEARQLPLTRLVFENVERVRNGGLSDSAAFDEALNRLRDELATAEEQIVHQAASEQAEAQQEERTLEIRYSVESTVERTVISMGQDIPDEAREQLMDAWVPLMTAQKTADAETSASSDAPADPANPDNDGMALLHELLALMQKEPDFQSSAPLLARIRAFLDRAPLSKEERARIKQDLVSAHLVAAGKRRSATADRQSPAEQAPTGPTGESGTSEERSEQPARKRASARPGSIFGSSPRHPDDDPSLMRDHDDEHVEHADNLISGTWIQFTSPAGTKVTRMKLVWRGSHAGRLLFTDAAGRAKRQHSIQGLAHEFRSGRAQIIPEESLFDHLMDQRLGQTA
ncbi:MULTISPECIES: DUF1631 family protein [Thioalkalivibrio]|uniref:DUF1631 family protein n=1 Tax=Thioalkalivibrio TaxID=106633 RepID=UPI00038217C5|nr:MULTISPECIES: DUF1631 family protein [Thioalkalivibrio]OOC48674.1 hypothetical protein B0684_08200 [Thioalkalivibrio versutus]